MISLGANGEKIAYGIKHFNLDTEADLKKLKASKNAKMGTTCFVIETSKYYMLNGEQNWIEITPYGKSISSDPVVPPTDNDIIYEGGEI